MINFNEIKKQIKEAVKNGYNGFNRVSEMKADTLCKLNPNGEKVELIKIGEQWYSYHSTPKGMIKDVFLYADSTAAQEEEIAEHDDENYAVTSDIGSFLVNGFLFSNGYGDGANEVVVRRFAKPTRRFTRAEIYGNPQVVRVAKGVGVKVWGNDCADVNAVLPIIDEPEATAIVLNGRKLYVIIEANNER